MSFGNMCITGERVGHCLLLPCYMLGIQFVVVFHEYGCEVPRYCVVEWLCDWVEGGVVESSQRTQTVCPVNYFHALF